MPDLDYSAKPVLGPRFYREGDEVMFVHVVDRANVLGPRRATNRDKQEHPELWAAYTASLGQLDGDNDGHPGGRRRPGRPRKEA
jgi:hypothetical protein